jgi:adenylate cyclase
LGFPRTPEYTLTQVEMLGREHLPQHLHQGESGLRRTVLLVEVARHDGVGVFHPPEIEPPPQKAYVIQMAEFSTVTGAQASQPKDSVPMTRYIERAIYWAREAKRRRVYTSAIAYIVVAVTIIELGDAVFSALALPDWSNRLVTILLLLGFPVVLVMAWVFDITKAGVQRTSTLDETGSSSARGDRVSRKARRVASAAISQHRTGKPLRPAEPADESEEAGPVLPPDPDRIKRAAIGHVRHELKTPINGILGYSEMILEDLNPEDRADLGEDLEKIRGAGRQLVRLIDQILNPAKIDDSVGIDLESYSEQIRVDLRNPINAVIGYAELLIETVEDSDRAHIVADLERIRVAARELLYRSTDVVAVATAHDPSLSAASPLATATALTEGVLSRAWARSAAPEEGMGSLLVVDDNPMNRDLLSRQLARAGYVVETAEGGHEALDVLNSRAFDLVLLDVIMPDMDGLEVLRRIKSDPRTEEIPVMMLSSLDDVESAIRCIELGADDFLHKPFHPTLLQARIGSSLEIRDMHRRVAKSHALLTKAEDFASRMLRGSFPAAITERLRAGESEILETYGEATVFWCDVEGAARSQTHDAEMISARLQLLLSTLDKVATAHGIETVTPSGGGVVLAGGIPTPHKDHAHRIAEAALDLSDRLASDPGFDAPVRVGVDCGEVTCGVFGEDRMEYRMWGEPMDLAQVLGAQAASGAIVVSPNAHRLLRDDFAFATAGVQDVPGRGSMKTYLLEGPA